MPTGQATKLEFMGEIIRVEPVMGDVPALGQHTEAVLAELGYDATAIARMRDSKAI